ncbi:Basal-body periplasmic P-ring protein [Pseudoalteromonas phenolica]|uniref:Flagella basal body P-ring formation protein FlgA n=3 Tax=Pseudoalteromonas phenolica TaxID=161398 RepID=A0A0S2JZ62_9GAMM|nr:Basal-body periplasmic P-ring protein [Pseudoalteromonas phenolica]MBE0354046.1 flagella basal body P-ring formation protein FlgA [Pseudoalteromonas phenolica O-BC30]
MVFHAKSLYLVSPDKHSRNIMSLLKKTKSYEIFCAMACFIASHMSQAQVYTNTNLEAGAEEFITLQVELNPDIKTTIKALPLDARLSERICEKPLSYSTNATAPFNRQVTVQVKCEDLSGWTQFVHVRIEELHPVIVTTQLINKGELLTKDSISIEYKPKHFVRASNLNTEQLLIGSRSKRVLRVGTAIGLHHICMVCKGDNVTIYAKTRTLTIKTTGIALQDGNIGEQIRVKNQKSGKTISARVKDVESVEVNI